MYAVRTGTAIRVKGTLERVEGCAGIDEDSWTRNAAGELVKEYAGETEMFWESQRTLDDVNGYAIYLDEDGEEVTEPEIELITGAELEARERADADEHNEAANAEQDAADAVRGSADAEE